MDGKASIGGRRVKGDVRSLHNWCGSLNLKASRISDPFYLAAIYRALFGNENEASALREALIDEAQRCEADHMERVRKATGPLSDTKSR